MATSRRMGRARRRPTDRQQDRKGQAQNAADQPENQPENPFNYSKNGAHKTSNKTEHFLFLSDPFQFNLRWGEEKIARKEARRLIEYVGS